MSIPSCVNLLRKTTDVFLRPNILSLTGNVICSREASKKAGSSTKGGRRVRPKHRGVRVYDGAFVEARTLLVVQNKLRFHPGLNVGMGRNGTLFALHPGTVMVTCEKPNLNWDHSWIQRNYSGRNVENLYKKYYHIITPPQHNRFKLIDQI